MKQTTNLVNDMRSTSKLLKYSFEGDETGRRSVDPAIDDYGCLTQAGAELLGDDGRFGEMVDPETNEKEDALALLHYQANA